MPVVMAPLVVVVVVVTWGQGRKKRIGLDAVVFCVYVLISVGEDGNECCAAARKDIEYTLVTRGEEKKFADTQTDTQTEKKTQAAKRPRGPEPHSCDTAIHLLPCVLICIGLC